MNIKSFLTPLIISKAYEFNSEYAWKPENIPELVSALKENRIAVLGGEVWEKTNNGPFVNSNIYQWNSKQKDNNESWNNYVDRTLKEMETFALNLRKEKELSKKWSEIYISIEMIDENEYSRLTRKK